MLTMLVIQLPLRGSENADNSIDRIREDIQYLASQELEGRGIGTKGLDLAANYIRDRFRKIGLKTAISDGSYFQQFDVPRQRKLQDVRRSSNDNSCVYVSDWIRHVPVSEICRPKPAVDNYA